LQAYRSEKTKHCVTKLTDVKIGHSKRFVEKAAHLGFVITPDEQRRSNILPPLFHSDQRQSLSQEFEQINEDMFSRKENKFMVFNGCGVDSWSGTKSITKTHHLSIFTDEFL
jgi:hypothetical protein